MKPGTKVNRWKDSEIAILSARRNELSDFEMAELLGRTEAAVQTKRMELKLLKEKSFVIERSEKSRFKPGNVSPIIPYDTKRKRADAWTDEQVSYLKANWEYFTSAEVAAAIGRTRSATTSKALELGIKKSEAATKEIRRKLIGRLTRKDGWKQHQLDYLKENWATQSAAEIAVAIGRSAASVKTRANDLGLKTDKEALRRILQKPNGGHFKPGGEIGAITTRTTEAGLKSMWIKIEPKKWIQLSHYNWFKAGFELPKGYSLCFKNGDTTDCSPENLEVRSSPRQTLKNKYGRTHGRPAKRISKTELKKQQRIEARAAKLVERAAQKENKRQERLDRVAARSAKIAAQVAERNLNRQQRSAARIADKPARPALRIAGKTITKPVAEHKPKVVTLTRKAKRQARDEERKLKEAAKLQEREKQKLIKQEQARKARALKEQQRISNEIESKRVMQTRPVDLSDKIALRIDHRTVIYIRPDQDPEQMKQKYLSKKSPDRYDNLPPVYQF